MRIAVIAHGLRVAGGRSVAQNIIASLSRIGGAHEYLLIMPKNVGYEEIEQPDGATAHYVAVSGGFIGRALYDAIFLPSRVKRWAPDCIFCLGNFGLRIKGPKQAVLFHKSHFVYPEVSVALTRSDWLKNRIIESQICRSLPFTDLVFCQTEALKQRYIARFNPAANVELLPNVVSKSVLAGNSDLSMLPALLQHDAVRFKFRLFALTRYYAHKNLEALLALFDKYRSELKDVICILTIDAKDHTDAARLLKKVETLGLSNQLINIGSVEQRLLPTLYEFSDALILPTLLESFSGTYVEAMRYCTPILTSDRDFAQAVCKQAALYFDPLDAKSILDVILRLKNDTKVGDELVALGSERLQELPSDWDVVVTDALAKLVVL